MADEIKFSPLPSRVETAVRNFIVNITPNGWFTPLQPQRTSAPLDEAGRRFDYPVGENMAIRTRPPGMVPFIALRNLANNCEPIALCIEKRKEQIQSLGWKIVPRDPDAAKAAKKTPGDKAKAATEFFQFPDKENDWPTWVASILDDMFVIDALTLARRRARDGSLYALELMDGATIKVLMDVFGRVPDYPNPAYQQIIKGQVSWTFDRSNIIYAPRTKRSWTLYGYSPVEKILITAETIINRSLYNANYYREGNVPQGFLFTSPDLDSQDVKAIQDSLDIYLSGNLGERRKIKVMPGGNGATYQELKAPALKDAADEFFFRIACFAFSMPPTAFVNQMNRATSETSKDSAKEEGLAPTCQWIKSLVDRVLREEMDMGDHEFKFEEPPETDPEAAARIRQGDVKSKIITVDEARDEMGKDPLTPEQIEAQKALAPPPPPGMGGDDPEDEPKGALAKRKKKVLYR